MTGFAGVRYNLFEHRCMNELGDYRVAEGNVKLS